VDENKYRKLDLDLPTQPIVDTKPWSIAGWIFAIMLIVFAIIVFILK
jgi:hypothetical protein